MFLRPLGVVIVLMCCGPSTSAPPAQSSSPSYSPNAPIGRDCNYFADFRHEHCAKDRNEVREQCQILLRLAEAAACVVQAQRSYDCGLSSENNCKTAACCDETIRQCDDIDTAFDHCVRGYCGSHGANPDCKAYGEMFGSGAS